VQLGSPGTYSGCAFKNNIVYGCTVTLGSGWVSDHNLIGGSNPFVGYTRFDYHLAPGSPAIHAGVTLGAPYNVDVDGNLRGAGSAWDIGAYEYVRRLARTR